MKLCILFVFLILLTCCQDNAKKDFIIDLPKIDSSLHLGRDVSFELTNNLTEELNLHKLKNGVDSFELRLRASISVTRFNLLFLIKKANDSWICNRYLFKYKHEGVERKRERGIDGFSLDDWLDVAVDSFRVEKLTPKSGWSSFIQKLDSTKIYELPSQNEIENWRDEVTDGIDYYVEFANNKKYKFIYYNCPDYYAKKYFECKQFNDFVKIIKEEFGMPKYGPYEWKCGI